MRGFEGKITNTAKGDQPERSIGNEAGPEDTEKSEGFSVMRKLFKPARRLAGAMSLMTLATVGESVIRSPEASAEEKQETTTSRDAELAREGLKILSADYETFDDKNPQIVTERLRRYEQIEKAAKNLPPNERAEFLRQFAFTALRHFELKYKTEAPLAAAAEIRNKELLKDQKLLAEDINALTKIFQQSTDGIAYRLLGRNLSEKDWKRIDAAKRTQASLRNLINGIASGMLEAVKSKENIIEQLHNTISQMAIQGGEGKFTFNEEDDVASGLVRIKGNFTERRTKQQRTINIYVSYDVISKKPVVTGDIGITPIHKVMELQHILKQEQR